MALSGVSANGDTTTRGPGIMVSIISPQLNSQITGYYDFEIYAESEGQVVNYVSVQISEDNITWKLVDFIIDPDPENHYVIVFDSTKFEDGDYYFRVTVKDDSDNSTDLFIGPLEVWNPDPPVIKWTSPIYEGRGGDHPEMRRIRWRS
jgi:hypothetical protein